MSTESRVGTLGQFPDCQMMPSKDGGFIATIQQGFQGWSFFWLSWPYFLYHPSVCAMTYIAWTESRVEDALEPPGIFGHLATSKEEVPPLMS